jgi:ferrous iron transport protein B
MSSLQHYALVGFANSGKSTLFNLLSGGSQVVGNWSGVTVSAKRKELTLANKQILLSDLPGLSSLVQRAEQGQDLTISHEFLLNEDINILINVVDATQLKRQLHLTRQLLELGIPMLVLLNKADRKEAAAIDCKILSQELGCQVVEISAQNKSSVTEIEEALRQIKDTYKAKFTDVKKDVVQDVATTEKESCECKDDKKDITDLQKRHQWVNKVVKEAALEKISPVGFSDKIDSVVLHPVMGIPVFLGMMYLLFMFAINIGGAFIDFFDILGGTLFVSYPIYYLEMLNLPLWLVTIFEGIGSGVQTVATFIPIIACLFIGLSLLESSGYLARAAFVVDSVMQKIGLPGKAFVPLIVGFGCTVPAVMSTRVLDSERERITTVMMSPFMSCGARLPVYALFAAAFFPENGQNLVFMLYLIGIAAAIFTGFLLKKTTLPGNSSLNIMELPLYEVPRLSYITARVWRRTKGFVTGAGKTIVIVVCLINFVNSIGTDGSVGNQDSESSVLSQSAKLVLPVLAPMGIKEDNWQAGVGIITGIFAKEVLVATFNSLYSPSTGDETAVPSLSKSWDEAVISIKANLLGLSPDDPLGMKVGDVSDLAIASQEQEVAITTYQVMQSSFDGQLGAFSYLLFILLYTPCIAAMGAIKNEVGTKWATFAALWSFTLAYLVATLCYQLGRFSQNPTMASVSIVTVFFIFFAIYAWLKHKGKKILTIPTRVYYS